MDYGPFLGGAFDFLVTIIRIWQSNPRFQVGGPWTAAIVSSLGANYGIVDVAQSSLFQFL